MAVLVRAREETGEFINKILDFELDFKIALASSVNIVLTNQLCPTCASQKNAISAKISLNLPRTVWSLFGIHTAPEADAGLIWISSHNSSAL